MKPVYRERNTTGACKKKSVSTDNQSIISLFKTKVTKCMTDYKTVWDIKDERY